MAEGPDAKDRAGRPIRGRKPGGSTCRCTPQTAHNVPREGTSKKVFPSSRQLRRPAAQESGCSIVGWYVWMGTMPFDRSRGRLTAGKASDRSGAVVRHTTTSGCSEGEYYATVSAQAACCSKERLSHRLVVRADGYDAKVLVGRPPSGRKFGKLPPESPPDGAWGRGWTCE